MTPQEEQKLFLAVSKQGCCRSLWRVAACAPASPGTAAPCPGPAAHDGAASAGAARGLLPCPTWERVPERPQGYPWKTAPSVPAASCSRHRACPAPAALPGPCTEPLGLLLPTPVPPRGEGVRLVRDGSCKVLSQGAEDPDGCKPPGLMVALTSGTNLQPQASLRVSASAGEGGKGRWKRDTSESQHHHELLHEKGVLWKVLGRVPRTARHAGTRTFPSASGPRGASRQHRGTLVHCCRQGRTFPVLHKNPAGTGSSTQADLPSSGAPRMCLNSTGPGVRNKHNSSFLQLLPASSWVFHLKSMAISSSSFRRHSASPWQAPEQGAASL